MPSDLAFLSTLIGSNYPCLELVFMVPMVFEPLKFDCGLARVCTYMHTYEHHTLCSIVYVSASPPIVSDAGI